MEHGNADAQQTNAKQQSQVGIGGEQVPCSTHQLTNSVNAGNGALDTSGHDFSLQLVLLS